LPELIKQLENQENGERTKSLWHISDNKFVVVSRIVLPAGFAWRNGHRCSPREWESVVFTANSQGKIQFGKTLYEAKGYETHAQTIKNFMNQKG